jgi:hypothetical protein
MANYGYSEIEDELDPYGESSPGYMRFDPRKPPPVPEEDLVRGFDDPRVPVEVAAELMRRYKAMEKGTPERKRGIVEHTDPETGQVTRYDRYGRLVRKGFEPDRSKGRVQNFFRWMATEPEGRQATIEAREREQADRQLDYENRFRSHQVGEASRAGAISNYNEWLEREEKRRMQEAAADATAAYRQDRLQLDREQMTTPRPVSPELAEYYDRTGRASLARAGIQSEKRPVGGLSHNQVLDRKQELDEEADAYQEALRQLASGDETIQSPVWDEELEITPENREFYQRRWQNAWRGAKGKRSDLEQQYDQFYESGRGAEPAPGGTARPRKAPLPGGTPQMGPGAGPVSGAGPAAGGLEAMKAQSWNEEPEPLEMPGAGEWDQLSPRDQMWFALLQQLEEQGYNVDAPSVQDYAMGLVREQLAGGRDARTVEEPTYHDPRWPSSTR